MYFGDWLRNSELKNVWYISYRSDDPDFPQRMNALLKRNGQVQRISSTCLMIESTDPKSSVIKRIRKNISEADEIVFFYPHHKIIGHQILSSSEED